MNNRNETNERQEHIRVAIQKVSAVDQWPWETHLPMKLNPWSMGAERYGIIKAEEPTVIYACNGGKISGRIIAQFDTVEAMCKEWGPE